MARGPISLTVSAVALAALTSSAASGQVLAPTGPFTESNPPPYPATSSGAYGGSLATVPQLFGYSGQSNKGCSAGNSSRGPGEYSPQSGPVSGRPQVVAVFPARGAVVRPGVVVVRVTFDRPMSCDASFGGSSDLPNPCPGRWREVTISADRRSFRTVCEVAPNMRYRLPLRSFRSVRDTLAAPYDVVFSTSGAQPVATVLEALAEDTGAGMVAGG